MKWGKGSDFARELILSVLDNRRGMTARKVASEIGIISLPRNINPGNPLIRRVKHALHRTEMILRELAEDGLIENYVPHSSRGPNPSVRWVLKRPERVTITAGRVELVKAWEDTLSGRELVERVKASALVWLNSGTEEGAETARRYFAAEDDGLEWHVFTLPTDEPDPIGKTKELVLEKFGPALERTIDR